jgi:lipopolysaccharide/colanic/teichoic acid biosynthesis glycosyltransferase
MAISRSKRAFDLVASGLGLAVLSPVLLLIGIAVATEDGGPILYRQERVGRGGRTFRILKFRTMIVDADKRGLPLTVGADSRITGVGRFLRRTKLDELPQLVNVVRGEMTLVGPRPEVARYVALYRGEQRRVLELTPGITDPASTQYVDESALLGASADPEREYIETVMPRKLQLNLAYAEQATFLSDLRVLLQTIGIITSRRRRTTP